MELEILRAREKTKHFFSFTNQFVEKKIAKIKMFQLELFSISQKHCDALSKHYFAV